MEKGVYHCFCYNKKFIFGYKLILSELSLDKPQVPELEISFAENNLLALEKNSTESLFFVYGNPFLLKSKVVKYAKNTREFKETSIQIQKINKINQENLKMKGERGHKDEKVLGEIDMNENIEETVEVNSEFKTILQKIKESKKENEATNKMNDSKISLLNVLRNAVINNDNKAFINLIYRT
jgi:hypothetical protein